MQCRNSSPYMESLHVSHQDFRRKWFKREIPSHVRSRRRKWRSWLGCIIWIISICCAIFCFCIRLLIYFRGWLPIHKQPCCVCLSWLLILVEWPWTITNDYVELLFCREPIKYEFPLIGRRTRVLFYFLFLFQLFSMDHEYLPSWVVVGMNVGWTPVLIDK